MSSAARGGRTTGGRTHRNNSWNVEYPGPASILVVGNFANGAGLHGRHLMLVLPRSNALVKPDVAPMRSSDTLSTDVACPSLPRSTEKPVVVIPSAIFEGVAEALVVRRVNNRPTTGI
jgi:hypothetical protein